MTHYTNTTATTGNTTTNTAGALFVSAITGELVASMLVTKAITTVEATTSDCWITERLDRLNEINRQGKINQAEFNKMYSMITDASFSEMRKALVH